MNRRVTIGVIAVLVLLAGALLVMGRTATSEPRTHTHRIDLVASVRAVNTDVGWSQSGAVTSQGAIRLSLDDLRVLTIPESTMVDDYSMMPACTDFVTPDACVLLADMLGDAVVWFALVPADKASGAGYLTLPGLVDMQDNGNEGVLRNGWIVKLATPVKRECGDTDTSSLRDFITRFPDTSSKSVVSLITDDVTKVVCTR